MKGSIDKDGFLSIVRKNVTQKQFCPHGRESERCGDWCPLFDDSDADIGEIRICESIRIDITDQRLKEKI
jgi:hypothetical protein